MPVLADHLAQMSLSYGMEWPEWTSHLGVALLVAAAISLPFVIWARARRWALVAFPIVCAIEFLAETATRQYGLLPLVIGFLAPWLLLLLWRRTRRAGLVLLGGSVIGLLVLVNYWAKVICTIGYVLLLLALWPRWRLMQAAPRGRERPPVIPSRGVLRARAWPACRRPEIEGFTLISALVGTSFVIMAAVVATEAISATMAAVRRADHLAVATDLLESARERSLLGGASTDLQAQASRLLPKGKMAIVRASAAAGLSRVSALATWEDPDGKAGQVALEWLAAESPP
jgi:hypothetical protein